MTDNVIQFRGGQGGNGRTPPPQSSPPVQPIGPRLAAFFLHGVSERLDRLQSTLHLLHSNLKANQDAPDAPPTPLYSLTALADLCSAEVSNINVDMLLPLTRGLEANCEEGAGPPGGAA